MPNGNGNNGATRKVRRSQAEKAEMYAEKIKVYADKLKDMVAGEGGAAPVPVAAKAPAPAAGLGAAAAAVVKKAPITCPGGPVLYNRFITSIKNLLKEKYQAANPTSSVKEFDSKYPHAKVKEVAGAAWKASKGAICGEEGDAALAAMAQSEADRIYSMTSGRGFTNAGRGTVENVAAAAARANTVRPAGAALGPPAGAGAQTKKVKKTVTILGANSPPRNAAGAVAKTAKVKKSKVPLFNDEPLGTTEENAAAAVARAKEALRKAAAKKAAKAPALNEANALAALAELEAEGVPTPAALTLAAPVNNSRKSRKAEKKRKAAAEKAAAAFEAAAVAAGLPPTGNTLSAAAGNLSRGTPTPPAAAPAGNLNLGRRTPTPPAAAAGNLNLGRRSLAAGNNGSPGLNLGAPTPVSPAEEAGGAASYSLPAGVTNLGAALNATGENTGLRKIRVGTNEYRMNNQRGLWSGDEGLEWVGLLRPNGSVEYTNAPPE